MRKQDWQQQRELFEQLLSLLASRQQTPSTCAAPISVPGQATLGCYCLYVLLHATMSCSQCSHWTSLGWSEEWANSCTLGMDMWMDWCTLFTLNTSSYEGRTSTVVMCNSITSDIDCMALLLVLFALFTFINICTLYVVADVVPVFVFNNTFVYTIHWKVSAWETKKEAGSVNQCF